MRFALVAVALSFSVFGHAFNANGQAGTADGSVLGIRIGEKLTYSVSIGRLQNAAYAELYAVSRGRLGDKDAIELRAKFRTLNLASATVSLVDEARTTFVSPTTGLPLHTTIIESATGLPKETNLSFVSAPTPHADLVTMVYKIRQMNGAGSFTLLENDKVYSVTLQPSGIEKHRTDVGEFETTLVSVQSEVFTAIGISDVRVNLSADEARIPVLVRFRGPKGVFRMALASSLLIDPDATAQPTPVPVRTPAPERTPKPSPSPTPYVDDQPLAPELAFDLGETLQYRISANGQVVARMTLAARERKQFQGMDSLVLEAVFSDVRAGSPFALGDLVRAYVDPDSLSPRQIELRFSGPLRGFSKVVKFERSGSLITHGGTNSVEAPVGTHSILSLLYAARSFNLKPSRDLSNPINDTRVAVFWDTEPYIFTLRPSLPEVLTIDGSPVAAQMVSVTTKNPLLDQLNIRFWLGNDEARVPLRFAIGAYQADLISSPASISK